MMTQANIHSPWLQKKRKMQFQFLVIRRAFTSNPQKVWLQRDTESFIHFVFFFLVETKKLFDSVCKSCGTLIDMVWYYLSKM